MRIATEVVNLIPTKTGRVQLVCHICGRISGARGTARFSDIPNGWSMAPYPAESVRPDGSIGSLYTCPTCCDRRDFPIMTRAYMRDTAG